MGTKVIAGRGGKAFLGPATAGASRSLDDLVPAASLRPGQEGQAVSGMAGAWHNDVYFQISAVSGLMVSVAIPPGDDGSAVGQYFEDANKPYQEWVDSVLGSLKARLDPLGRAGVLKKIDGAGGEPDAITFDRPLGQVTLRFLAEPPLEPGQRSELERFVATLAESLP